MNDHYFYNGAHDSDYGKICGVKGLTLDKAMAIMKAKGFDFNKNFKMSVAVFY